MEKFKEFLQKLDISDSKRMEILSFFNKDLADLGFFMGVNDFKPDLIIIHDKNLIIKDCKCFNGIVDEDEQCMVGKNLQDCLSFEEFGYYKDNVGKISSHGESLEFEALLLGKISLALKVTKHFFDKELYIIVGESVSGDNEENKAKYRDMVESIHDISCLYDIDGKISYISPQVKNHGFLPKELIGKHFSELVHPDDVADVKADFKIMVKTGKSLPSVFRFREKKGNTVYFEVLSKPRMVDGVVVEFNATLRDITERKLSEEALAEAESKYRSIFEHMIDVYFQTDKDGCLTLVSPSGSRLFGYSNTVEMLGKSITDFLYYDIEIDSFMEEMKTQERIINSEVTLKSKEGNKIYSEINARAVFDRQLQFQGIEGIIRDISDWKNVVEMVKESEEKYHKLVDFLPLSIYEMDINGRFTFANAATSELLGFSSEDIVENLDIKRVVSSHEHKRLDENFRKALEGTPSADNEYTIISKDGTRHSVLIYSSPIRQNNQVIGIRGVLVDITKRKVVERKLSQSERDYREFNELLPLSVFEIDKDGFITYLNKIGYKITGLTKDRIQDGVHIKSIISRESYRLFVERMDRISRGIKIEEVEYQLKTAKGDEIPALVYSTPIFVDGIFSGVRGIAIDITSQKEQAERLYISKQRLQLALEGANEGLWDWNIETGEAFFSDIWLKMLGYEEGELENHYYCWESLLHPDDKPKTIAALEAHLRGETKSYQTEFRMRTKDGRWKWIMSRGRVIKRDINGNPLRAIGTQIDISEKKASEEKLKEAEKMESLVRLADGVAKELNKVLFGIISYPDLILMKIPEDSSLRKYIEKIKVSSSLARKLIHDLLTLSSEEKSEKKYVNVNDLIYKFINSLDFENLKSDNPNIEFKIVPGKSVANAKVSDIQILRCITNIMIFAAESQPNGGEVNLSSQMKNVDNSTAYGLNIAPGEFVVITISDNSGGITEEDCSRIFEPFYTSDVLKRGGTGLGLAIVWSIVKEHNGHISVNTEEGRGTQFDIYLPLEDTTN